MEPFRRSTDLPFVMRKIFCFSALVVVSISLSTSGAAAHATFVGAPNGVPAGSEQALVMGVPHERDDTTYNVDIVIAMPANWQALSCQTKPTWTCSIGTSGGRPVVRFVKDAGSGPAEDESFGFSVRASTVVGSFSFPTVQTYNTGEVVRWIDGPGGGEPAPVLATLPSGVAPETTAPTTTVDHTPSTVPQATPSTARVPTTSSLPTTAPPSTSAPTTRSAPPPPPPLSPSSTAVAVRGRLVDVGGAVVGAAVMVGDVAAVVGGVAPVVVGALVLAAGAGGAVALRRRRGPSTAP